MDDQAYFEISLTWFNTDDLDLHVIPPSRERIYHKNPGSASTGILKDHGNNWETVSFNNNLEDGLYIVEVDNSTRRDLENNGFQLRIICDKHDRLFRYENLVTNVVALTIRIKDGVINDIRCSGGVIDLN